MAFLNAYSEGLSGGDACFIEIAKRQPDWDLSVVTSALGRELCSRRGLDARFLVLSRERAFRRPILTYVARTLRGISSLHDEAGADVYYGTSDFLPDTVLARRLRRRHPRSVWVQKVFHLIPRSRAIPHLAQNLSLQLIRRSADRVIVDNDILRTALMKRGIEIDRIGLNYPGIDSRYFAGLPSGGSTRYDAAFLGRLVPSKGVLDLVPIWKGVVDRHPSARLAIIGHGQPSFVRELRERIDRSGLAERIDVLGHLGADDAFAILKASRVFVFPSREEGFGIAALEAIACGLPVVAYDLPAYAEAFPAAMVRVPISDVGQFASVTCKLLSGDRFRERVLAQADELPFRYDWDRVAAREAQEISLALEQARCT